MSVQFQSFHPKHSTESVGVDSESEGNCLLLAEVRILGCFVARGHDGIDGADIVVVAMQRDSSFLRAVPIARVY